MDLDKKPLRIFYHASDLDGIGSAAVVLAALAPDAPKATLHPINYGDPFPWADVLPGAAVVMVDFSLPGEEMYNLAEVCRLGDGDGGLLWFDHHKTAIEAVEAHQVGQPAIEGRRDTTLAAIELVAEWMLGRIPLAARLLGRYDAWDHGFCPNILEFQYGMRNLELTPGSPMWRILFNPTQLEFAENMIQERIRDGSAILAYVRQDRRRTVASGAHLVNLSPFLPYRALACNASGGSALFDDAPAELLAEADVLLTYVWSGSQNAWLCGLYHKPGRTDVDCGAIAKGFGGGGHKGSAGFRIAGPLPQWLY